MLYPKYKSRQTMSISGYTTQEKLMKKVCHDARQINQGPCEGNSLITKIQEIQARTIKQK